jgi:hypothetical protein
MAGRFTGTQIAAAATIGGLAGAALRAQRGARAAAAAAVAGAVILAGSEAVARLRQRPNEMPALWHRILVSAALAAPLGWAADRLGDPRPRTVGLAAGSLAGAMVCARRRSRTGRSSVGWWAASRTGSATGSPRGRYVRVVGSVPDASARRACSRVRISSAVYARRRRSARAITTPVAATPTKPARPTTFHQRMCLG